MLHPIFRTNFSPFIVLISLISHFYCRLVFQTSIFLIVTNLISLSVTPSVFHSRPELTYSTNPSHNRLFCTHQTDFADLMHLH